MCFDWCKVKSFTREVLLAKRCTDCIKLPQAGTTFLLPKLRVLESTADCSKVLIKLRATLERLTVLFCWLSCWFFCKTANVCKKCAEHSEQQFDCKRTHSLTSPRLVKTTTAEDRKVRVLMNTQQVICNHWKAFQWLKHGSEEFTFSSESICFFCCYLEWTEVYIYPLYFIHVPLSLAQWRTVRSFCDLNVGMYFMTLWTSSRIYIVVFNSQHYQWNDLNAVMFLRPITRTGRTVTDRVMRVNSIKTFLPILSFQC